MEQKVLQRYLNPGKSNLIVGGVILASGILPLLFMPPVFLCTLAFSLMYSWSAIRQIDHTRHRLKHLSEQGALDGVLADFQNSQSRLNDSLRLGAQYLYGHRTGTMVRYQEITRAYQHIHKTNGYENSRQVKIMTADGETLSLCALQGQGADDVALTQLFHELAERNPKIRLNYPTSL
jgi:hypothetical protein